MLIKKTKVSGANKEIMNCKICNAFSNPVFEAIVLNKYKVKYFSCPNCEYLFTENPYWLTEAYKKAINLSDTGILERNILFSKLVSILIYFFYSKDFICLDYAGGYGIFTRLMRDIGFNFYWYDPITENLLANGFEYEKVRNKEIGIITLFETFEHFENPTEELEKLLAKSTNIIFSTVLLPEQVPEKSWWYYAFEHGQHISFYSKKTLKFLAEKFNMKFYSICGLHIFTKKRLNFLMRKLLSFNKTWLFFFVKKKLTSKTWQDHILLKHLGNEEFNF